MKIKVRENKFTISSERQKLSELRKKNKGKKTELDEFMEEDNNGR